MNSEQDRTDDELPDLMESGSASVGDRLRTAREGKRLELAHVAAETRIPVRHLKSIEKGAFHTLPSRTYAIGFSKTFARSVGLDPDEIAGGVRDELADGYGGAAAMAGGMEPGDAAKVPSSGLAWFGALAAVLLALGIVFFYNTYYGSGANPPSLLAETEEAVTGRNSELASSDVVSNAPLPDAPNLSGQVVFTALEDGVWVRFYEDGGERLFEAQMANGDRFELPTSAVEPRINTGRPDAFAITIGGQSVPKLAEAPVTMGDTPISAEALLARATSAAQAPISVN